MKKIIEKELGNIEIPKDLHKISESGVKKASLEIQGRKGMSKYIKRASGLVAASLVAIILIGTIFDMRFFSL